MREGKKKIIHNGLIYFWRSFFADGSYYENESGYVLTDREGRVEFSSAHALEIKRRLNE